MTDRHAGRLRSELTAQAWESVTGYRRELATTAEDVCTRIRDAIDRVTEDCDSGEDRGRAHLEEIAGIESRRVAFAASWTADLVRSGSAGRPARGGILRSGDEARPQVRLLALMASTAGPNGTDVGAPGGGEDRGKFAGAGRAGADRRPSAVGVTGTSERLELAEVAERARRILDQVERAVVGKRSALELALCALLADGHVLIEDYPGLAKTLIARSLATVTGTGFSRVQFTPDLMPSDVTGAAIFNQRTTEFEFRPGPVFTNVLLADEINRAPPKTQAALLEAMQERQVTSDDTTRPLQRPFLVLATQNPIEYEGTYPLPEAQLDRFLIRMRVGYPTADDEWEMLKRRLERRGDEPVLAPVIDRRELARDAGRGGEGARGGERRPIHRGARRVDAGEPERPGRR